MHGSTGGRGYARVTEIGTRWLFGLFGVLLVQSQIFRAVEPQRGAGVFAAAVIFGYAQYLFTRLVDKQARDILGAAGSRDDPASKPQGPGVDLLPTGMATNGGSSAASG